MTTNGRMRLREQYHFIITFNISVIIITHPFNPFVNVKIKSKLFMRVYLFVNLFVNQLKLQLSQNCSPIIKQQKLTFNQLTEIILFFIIITFWFRKFEKNRTFFTKLDFILGIFYLTTLAHTKVWFLLGKFFSVSEMDRKKYSGSS